MKHGKNPTRAQCKEIESHGLRSENWLVVKDTPGTFQIMNRKSGRLRTFEKHHGYTEELYFERR